MVKEEIKKKESIVYATLRNALLSDSVAHSYLFAGDLNPLKTRTAILLAQSIVEGKGDFACETCKTCNRIKQGLYYDVRYLDGRKESIKDEQIEDLLNEFSRTALEKSGKKIYIIDNVNHMSSKAMNHLLKFMEEPSSDNTYGIFITDDIDGLLPTIVSRCQTITFKTHDFSEARELYENAGFETIDAYLLVNVFHSFNEEIKTDDSSYLLALDAVKMVIDHLDTPYDLPALLYKQFYLPFGKGRENGFMDGSEYFMKIFRTMLEDAISDKRQNDHEYDSYLSILQRKQPVELLGIINDIYSRFSSSADRKLLFDQMAFEIISYTSRC